MVEWLVKFNFFLRTSYKTLYLGNFFLYPKFFNL